MKVFKIVILALLLIICSGGMAKGIVGQKAPQIAVKQWVTANPPQLEKLTGRVYLVEFWATWCRSCVQTTPDMIKLYNKYKDRGLEFIALSSDRSVKVVQQYVKKKRINYHVAMDNGSADSFGVRAYPTLVLVNHKGIVVWSGYPWSRALEKQISKTLDAAPPAMLGGIDMGPYEKYNKQLAGGKGFAQVYHRIKYDAMSPEVTQETLTANAIIHAIDTGISCQIEQADFFSKSDPIKAYHIYDNIVARYDGIDIVEPAKLKRFQLFKKIKAIGKRTLATSVPAKK